MGTLKQGPELRDGVEVKLKRGVIDAAGPRGVRLPLSTPRRTCPGEESGR